MWCFKDPNWNKKLIKLHWNNLEKEEDLAMSGRYIRFFKALLLFWCCQKWLSLISATRNGYTVSASKMLSGYLGY